ncbi:hypothetical protein MHI43_29655 [Paenibacillus sp. FSL H8-0457]
MAEPRLGLKTEAFYARIHSIRFNSVADTAFMLLENGEASERSRL